MIVGENGAGKSTILDALCFALFGKAFRNINKPKLVNSVNDKNCMVEVDFTVANKSYHICRGIKPNIFEIWCNGIMINQDSKSTDYQDHLEKFILKMTYKSFTQIVILGSASFTPFMQLKPADRRAVIEDLLDIQVFSVMNEIVKQRLQINKENIEKNRILTIGKAEKKAFVERTLAGLRSNSEAKKAELTQSMEEYKSKKTIVEREIQELGVSLDSIIEKTINKNKLQNKYNKLLLLKSQIESKHKSHQSSIDFFHDSETCPTCRQEIDDEFKKSEVAKLTEKLPEFVKGIKDIEKAVDDNLAAIGEIDALLAEAEEIKTKRAMKSSEMATYLAMIDDLNKSINALEKSDTVMEENERELKETIEAIEAIEKERQELLQNKLFIETAINLLKDGGIKTKIIKQYLPVINKLINKYLQQMGFFVNFNINESFEETILSRYRDSFSYENFSEGEKMRIDLAILFTWRAIAKMRNSINTNLLLFDEVFDGSLDANGTDEFLKIMWNLAGDTNVFVISHKQDQLVDKFKKVYKFAKKQNFSVVTI